MAKKKLSAEEMEQPPIPGAEQNDKIPAIHLAALKYKDAQNEFSQAGEELEESRLRLVGKMQGENLTHYSHGNVVVDLRPGKDRVKVKIANSQDE